MYHQSGSEGRAAARHGSVDSQASAGVKPHAGLIEGSPGSRTAEGAATRQAHVRLPIVGIADGLGHGDDNLLCHRAVRGARCRDPDRLREHDDPAVQDRQRLLPRGDRTAANGERLVGILSFSEAGKDTVRQPAPAPQTCSLPGSTFGAGGIEIFWSDWISYKTQSPGRSQMLFRILVPQQTLPLNYGVSVGNVGHWLPNSPVRLIELRTVRGDQVSNPESI
jgi:hypothetical protein